jgi:hypothetical protein
MALQAAGLQPEAIAQTTTNHQLNRYKAHATR